jgi:hypothetical protein
MQIAEELTTGANDRAGDAGLATGSPLQIRMNPFVAVAKRTPSFDARIYLGERASSIGRPNLLTKEASNLAVDGSRGLPRDLRGIAQFAFFAAASEGASQIDSRHVAIAMESWTAQNGEPGVGEKLRRAERAPRVGPRAASDVGAETAPPVVSTLPIRRDVLPTTGIAATAEFQLPKRRWVKRSVEITAVFVALFALVGVISSQVTISNFNGTKRSMAVPAVSEPVELTTAIVQPPASPEPLRRAAGSTEPARKAAIVSPLAAPPTKDPATANPPARGQVENVAAGNPALDREREQVPTEDHIKSETP